MKQRVGIREAQASLCVAKSTVGLIVLIILLGCLHGPSLKGQDRSIQNVPPVILEIAGVEGADISPSEDVVAVTTCVPLVESGMVSRHSDFLETWNIRTSKMLQRERLNEGGVQIASCEAGEVRYSADGKLLVARTGPGDLIRVFSAETLKILRTIQIPLPVSEIHVNWQTGVTGFEVSPVGHLLALRINRGDYDKHTFINSFQYLGGFLRVYDFDSGVQVNEWEIPTGHLAGGSGLAWRQDGNVLAVAASDRPPCYSGGGTVYLFDVSTSRQIRKIRLPNLVGDIAFGTGDTIYAANGSCPGYFGNRNPRLPILNAASGNKLGDIEFEGSGVRYNLAVSANRKALLGFVGREVMRWEFEDTLEVLDKKFAVWDLATRRLLYVSSDLGRHGPNQPVGFTFRLSASGRWALVRPTIDRNQVWLFPIPASKDAS